jgi:hypothetical protein
VRSGGQTAPIEVDPRFEVRAASDVIHPRMMEFLMERAAAGFRIEGDVLRSRSTSTIRS